MFAFITQCWQGFGSFGNGEEEVIKPCMALGCQRDTSAFSRNEMCHSVPLSPMDYVSAPTAEVTFCMVFDATSSLDAIRLKHSLTCTLGDYPLFAGHIESAGESDPAADSGRKGGEQLRIVNSKRGVKWISREARTSKHTIKRLLPFINRIEGSKEASVDFMFRSPVMHPYYHRKVKYDSTLWTKQGYLMQVFLTRLIDGGFVLIVTTPHLVTDLQPLRQFMKSWSTNYTKEEMHAKTDHEPMMPTAQKYLFDRGHKTLSSLPPNTDVYDHFNIEKEKEFLVVVQSSRIYRYPKILRLLYRPRVKAVHVTEAAIARARTQAIDEIRAKGWCSDERRCSDNDILTAIVWKAMARRAKKAKNKGKGKPDRALVMVCNMRKRMQGIPAAGDGPLPNDCLGNCLAPIYVGRIAYSDREKPIATLAAQVRNAVNNFQPDAFVSHVAKATEILKDQPHAVPYPSYNPDSLDLNPFKANIPVVVTNWNFSKGFESEINFGGNKPLWMEPGLLRADVIVITPAPSHIRGGGYILTLQMNDGDIHVARDWI